MKETYRIPSPPEISCNGNLVDSGNSEEILSVLGFCASETKAAQEAPDVEPLGLDAIESTFLGSYDDDHVYQTNCPFPTGWRELDLWVEAI
jgi:hypothetical protein